jgi:hypothetical protein
MGGRGGSTRASALKRERAAHNLIPDIRAAYDELASRPGAWVSIADLRDRLDASRQEMDIALRQLEQERDVNIVPESNQKALTDRMREGAVVIGDQKKHMIAIGGPSLGG